MQKYQEFKTKWLGKGIDYDGSFGYQCFDVINQYILELTGQRPLMQLMKASDIFKRPQGIFPDLGKWQIIPNSNGLYPKQGDIIVWDDASWNGFYGHTAIIDSANNDNCQALQQNGLAPNEPCKIQFWNFWSTPPLGWIRLIEVATPQPNPEFKKIFPDVGSGLWALCKKAGYPVIPTNEPNAEPTNSICYNRIEELNKTKSIKVGAEYIVDFDPIKWFNSRSQPQQEAITFLGEKGTTDYNQPSFYATSNQYQTMPTIKIENNPDQALQNQIEQEQEDKQDIVKQVVDELKEQIPQADTAGQATKEKFDFNKLISFYFLVKFF